MTNCSVLPPDDDVVVSELPGLLKKTGMLHNTRPKAPQRYFMIKSS